MITAKTSSGFEIELDENIFLKDTELTEAIVFLDTDEWWKNNSFTPAALQADQTYDKLKAVTLPRHT